MQMGRLAPSNGVWQHYAGDVASCQWLVLHDGAGRHPRTAEALPFKANL